MLSLSLSASADTVMVDCSGQTSGAFTSINGAIDSLAGPPPTAGAWDYVLLKSDCTENVVVTGGRRLWIAPEWDSCPWAACTTNGPRARIIAANAGHDVVTVEGPQVVTLVHLALSGGRDGLNASGNASVTTYGTLAEANSRYGFNVFDGAVLRMHEGGATGNGYGVWAASGGAALVQGGLLTGQPLVVSGNATAGVHVDRGIFYASTDVVVEDNLGYGLSAYGGDLAFGDYRPESVSVLQNNAGGAFLSEGSQVSFFGGAILRNNGPFGVYVEGGHATFIGNSRAPLVEGHARVGVHVAMNSQASFHGPVQIRDNGSPIEPARSGVWVDGNSQATFAATVWEGSDQPPEVTDNAGPGIVADFNSSIDARAVILRGNRGEGVRLRHMSAAFVGGTSNVRPNASGPLTCDSTSLAVTDLVHKGPGCHNVEKPSEARLPRPPQPK
jgi:hypothetical protein